MMNCRLVSILGFFYFLWQNFAFAINREVTPLEKSPLILGQGEQRLLKIPGLLKYSLGGTAVRIHSSSQRINSAPLFSKENLLIKGVRPGTSDLWAWKADGSSEFRVIRVEKKPIVETHSDLERALGTLEEAEVIFSGRGVILRGEVQHFSETGRIANLCRNFPGEVHDETLLSDTLLEQASQNLKRWLQKTGYSSSLRIETLGQSVWLRGHLSRPSEKVNLEGRARGIFPLVKTEIDTLPDSSPTIHFRVFLVELKKTHFSTWGLSPPSQVLGSLQVTPAIFLNPLQIDFTLQQLEGNGDAKVLSNPELVVRVPGEAELFAGGEIPIQTQNRFFSSVVWKNYGLTLRLKVTHSAGDQVRLEIYTEVSHLDGPNSSDRIPGIQANRMKTQVDAHYGKPLFLSGLLQQGMREEARGLPFLKNIPVLGLLFGSKDYLNERSELIALLYPHSSPPAAPDEKQTLWVPKGPLPLPRNWITPQEERLIRTSQDFPWNVLE